MTLQQARQNESGWLLIIGIVIVVLLTLTARSWYVTLPVLGILLVTAAVVRTRRIETIAAATTARGNLAAQCVANPDNSLQTLPDKEVILVAQSPSRYRGLVVLYSALDGRACPAASRADAAVAAITASPEYRKGTCGSIGVSELLRHQWEIATALRDITERRAELPRGDAGPITAPVVAAQTRAVAIAEEATDKRVRALEHYAAQVAAADATRRDWAAAQRAARNNDKFADLVARTAADELATADLTSVGASAKAAAKVLAETLASATLAAETLTL